MESLILTNTTIFTGEAVLHDHALWMQNGKIHAIMPVSEIPEQVSTLDLTGAWLAPGFIDFQLYGGNSGFLTRDGSVDSLTNMYETHLLDGTTTIVPTVYSTSKERILAAIEAVHSYWKQGLPGVAGLHVEGPFINPVKRGAHSDKMVRPPTYDELSELMEKGRDVIKVMTIAPECFEDSLLALLRSSGWAISAGHTNATSAQLNEYFDKGFSIATHLYNAMRPLESRELGVVGTIFEREDIHASIIVDGFHCDYGAVRIAKKLLGERLFLISDATFARYTGGRFVFEDFTLNYDGERFVNDAGALAGSAITLLDAVRNCIQQVHIAPDEAFRMASAYPAKQLKLDHQLGYLKPGFAANIIALSPDLSLQQVWVNGVAQQ
ncbi:N-acetylglucosamine-6-phosphate deacetylase [Arundinibacter roseus]|uniref:N-acetylglucosamine-6-phosphate deacetylase n=1 Tax=Arundinibacter roseus TaxID=2070510 RepID=A0A4R4KBM3_9BACT|nr:N-acetylglucosamine-6-phosphate deacetylase [Arundinibacter roseus]TDB64086.1 N-acetylglucosamine-6-phosphate deacetylase [Arundinibacter roseus]